MQDRYVGDIGDYGKYALLRHIIINNAPLVGRNLAIVWCLFPDENHNNDGQHVRYLQRQEYRELDPELFSKLKNIVENGRRRVSVIAELKLFPEGTAFVESYIAPEANVKQKHFSQERLSHREEWLEACLTATEDHSIVFFDPDNGFEIASINKKHPKAGKYVFWDELREFWNRGQSLVIYHHLNRTASVYHQMGALKGRLSKEIPGQYRVLRLIFRRGSCRSYWLLLQSDIANLVEERVAKMMQSGWRQHFELI